ncbi:aldo/keto reductase [Kribbella sp. NBC_01245]|uniref:aldo/keto reductase n=1 Tax=Kribbella sp. NBC_01245 TaxID=2903578 RepID=UPI002E2BEF15|nr:aldo/keto reductase [Kribbella sp. NBC_01245]
MSIRVVIQSRLSSSRLPGKALLTIAGQPMVVLAARRVARDGIPVVVATSSEPEDDAIAQVAADFGVTAVRGSLEDPLSRFMVATEGMADDDIVVRLTADNVVPDADLVREMVDLMQTAGVGYVRVGGPGAAVPYGVAAEAFPARLLREADAEAVDRADREHVTPYIRRVAGDKLINPSDLPENWGSLRCTVDALDDYDRVWRLFEGDPDPIGVSWRELCSRLDSTGLGRLRVRRKNVIEQGPYLLGTVQLGLEYGAANTKGLPTDTEAYQILNTAAEVGVSHLDTARAYGDSEKRIGTALARGLGERLGVVTKLRPLDDVPADAPAGWARAALDASVAESLRNLRASKIDALLLHRTRDLYKGGTAIRDGLRDLRENGIVTLTGVSVMTPVELIEVLADPEVGYVQLPFNLVDTRWVTPEVTAALVARPDVVITVRSVFLQGLLVGGDNARWPVIEGVDADYSRVIRRTVDELVADFGRANAADLCLAYVLGHEWVTSVVLGADTPAQVREQAELIRHKPVTREQMREVRARLGDLPEALVDPAQWKQS